MLKIFKILTLICLLISECFLTPAFCDATESGRVVRVGFTYHPGFIEKMPDGSYKGFGIEYLNEVAKYTGWQYKFISGTRGELATMLGNGQIDLMVPVMKTSDREAAVYDYPLHAMGTATSGIYVPEKDNKIHLDDYTHMQGMRLGCTPGSFQTIAAKSYAQKHGFTFTEVPFHDYNLALKALDNHEIDGLALSSLYKVKGYRPIAITTYAPFFIVAKNHSDGKLLGELDEAVERITYNDSGFFSTIFEKFYGHNSGARPVSLTIQEDEYIKQGKVIRVGCYTDWYPLVYHDKTTDTTKGILIDILQMIAQKSGLKFEFVPINEDSAITALKNKTENIDLFIAVVATKDRLQDSSLVLSHKYFPNARAFAGRKGETFDIRKSYRVAIPVNIKGSGNFLQENFPQFQINYYPNLEDCLRAVRDGKVDAAFQNSYLVTAMLQHPEFDKLTIWDVSSQIGGAFYMAGLSNLNPQLISILNKYIDNLPLDDVQAIISKNTALATINYSFMDLCYKYSLPLEIAALFIILIIIVIVAYGISNKRHIETLNIRNKELLDAITQANLASQAKSDFLSRMSHELRTPMNVILGMTQVAREHLGETKNVFDCLTDIEQSSQILLNVINDVLDMSAIEHSQMKIASLPFDIDQMLDPILKIYTRQCLTKEIHLKVVKEMDDMPPILGDSKRVAQIILNLLSNAVKFTPRGGTITLSVLKQRLIAGRQYMQFSVADTGIGMSEAFRERLFKPFEQESAATFEKYGGSGLGLSITLNLVKLMDGDINATSKEGVGTKFTVNLPFGVAEGEALAKFKATAAKDPSTILAPNSLQGKHILLVEDNIINQKVVLGLLKPLGATFSTADNGQIAVDMFIKAEPHTYDLILMDIKMPVLNGYEATDAIRNSNKEDAATIPIIALSANAFTEDVSKSLSAGMNGHVAKPINLRQLYNVLARFLLNQF
jgi:signal transduction histidine kinase